MEIGSWALGVSACAIAVCLVELLISDTALEKTVRTTLGVVMLCAVLLPLGGLLPELSSLVSLPEQAPKDSGLPETLSQQREDMLNRELSELMADTLKKEGITPVKIQVQTKVDENNCLSVTKAEVTLSGGDARRSAEISRLIKKELGIDCRTLIVD